MSDFRCRGCESNFSTQESLDQHGRDKHGIGDAQSKHELMRLKKQDKEKQIESDKKKAARSRLLKRSAYVAVPVILIVTAFAFISSQPPAVTGNSAASASEIPRTPIHWHPKLTIELNGQKQTIPADIGATGVHYPVHTHDATGVLHYEINDPTPENMRLHYFFEKVWGRPFNGTCILDYCNNDSGTVKMFVNGKENYEFENYMPRDGDDIRI